MSNDSEPIVTTVEELAAHDRRIKAEAWAEGHEAGHREGLFTGMEHGDSPAEIDGVAYDPEWQPAVNPYREVGEDACGRYIVVEVGCLECQSPDGSTPEIIERTDDRQAAVTLAGGLTQSDADRFVVDLTKGQIEWTSELTREAGEDV